MSWVVIHVEITNHGCSSQILVAKRITLFLNEKAGLLHLHILLKLLELLVLSDVALGLGLLSLVNLMVSNHVKVAHHIHVSVSEI